MPPESKSRFLSSYSARDVIEKSLDLAQGKGEFRSSGGGSSSVLGSGRIYHLDDTADLRISQNEERSFLERIKGQIELQLQSAGCRITDAGSGENDYSIAYTDQKVHGRIDIRGTRSTSEIYRLVITITEY